MPHHPPTLTTKHRGWATRKMDRAKFAEALSVASDPEHPQTSAEQEAINLARWLSSAADASTPRRGSIGKHLPVAWWNSDIEYKRKACFETRRAYQRKLRKKGAALIQAEGSLYKKAREELAIAIKIAKDKCWADLLATIDKDIWGRPYKIVTKRLRRRRPIAGIEEPVRLAGIVDALYPEHQAATYGDYETINPEMTPPFIVGEIITAVEWQAAGAR